MILQLHQYRIEFILFKVLITLAACVAGFLHLLSQFLRRLDSLMLFLIHLWRIFANVKNAQNATMKNVSMVICSNVKLNLKKYTCLVSLGGITTKGLFKLLVAISQEMIQLQEPVAVADIFVKKFSQCKQSFKCNNEKLCNGHCIKVKSS